MAPRLLIVDDSALGRQQIRQAAEHHFQVVGEAENGETAVKLYVRHRPQVVTLDIVMPGMDGIETVRRIRALDPDARLVMVAAAGQEGLVMESLVAGARDYVAKPIDPVRLVAALEAVMKT